MRKQLTAFLCLAVLCAILLCPLGAQAAALPDPHREASLTLQYQKDGQAFPGLSIEIYRVAELRDNGAYFLIQPFASYPVNIDNVDSQERWKHISTTLNAYIVADGLSPYRKGSTDGEGKVFFGQLEPGLYLVQEVIAENNGDTYVFNRFMVYLPTPLADGSYEYDVEANPKCVGYTPKKEYRVTKLWQDGEGHPDRPGEVTMDVYKDGVLQESKVLNASNDWTYTWYVSEEDTGVWTVVERDVHQAYTVSILQNGNAFTIINTLKSDPEPPDAPPTGDSFNPFPYVMTMCLSGSLLMILGVYRRRQCDV